MDWLEELRETGAYLEGHFLLTTGRHSDRFFLMARLTEHPERLERWVQHLAERVRRFRPEAVVGPAVGGIIPAWALARILGVRALFCEKVDGTMAFRRGFVVGAGEPVVVVEDAVTTGHSVQQVIDAVVAAGGTVRAVAALVDRTGGEAPWPYAYEACLRVRVDSWEAAQCPLCRAGVPLSRPKG
ncbi:MAG: orotate phosphoribosyltransferase [Firmicutes bacterium]|nr:orotate phosphoribosyltransferase [Alicyclobacillaceae bacterium]MCL6496484.1 orotate phosphoribosyltransferase [Bacillota bacterium]